VLGVIADPQAVPNLLELLLKEKGNKWERMIVDLIRALSRIGDPRACSSLNDLLSYPDNNVSREARYALVWIERLPAEVERLKSNDWYIRSEAASTLRRAGWRPRTSSQKILFCLGNHQDPYYLVSIGAPAVPALLEVLRNPEDVRSYGDRHKVVEVLAEIGSTEAILGLSAIWIEGKNTPDWKFKEFVAEALFKLKWRPQSLEERLRFYMQVGKGFNELDEIGKSVVPEILEFLKAEFLEQGYVSGQALEVLERLGDVQAGPGLFEMLKSGNNWHHKTRVFQALRKIGWQPQSGDDKLVYYSAGSYCIRSEEWSELVEIGDLTVPWFLQLFNNMVSGAYGEHMRWTIVTALGNIGDEQAVPTLLEVFTSFTPYTDYSMHNKAIEALQKIGGTQVVSGLIKVLLHENDTLQIDAARTLGKIGDPQAVPSLLETLKVTILDGLKMEIVEALGLIGDMRAIPALTEMLNDSKLFLRNAAQLALDCIDKTNKSQKESSS